MENEAEGPKFDLWLPPGASLASFWASRKKLAAGCARRRVSERNRPQGGS